MIHNTNLSTTSAIVLAAGRGTRMNSTDKNKVVLPLGSKPIVAHAVEHLHEAGVGQIIAVVGFQSDSVRQALGTSVDYAIQKEQLGTGDALKSALPLLNPSITTVLSVYGDDSAFYPPALYIEMVQKLESQNCDLLFLTIHKNNPAGLGRIVRDTNGKILRIVEEKNANQEEKEIQEINTGFYCFKRNFLETYIGQIKKNELTGEYYATDMVEIALQNGKSVDAHFVKDDSIWHGVNRPEDLVAAQNKIKHE